MDKMYFGKDSDSLTLWGYTSDEHEMSLLCRDKIRQLRRTAFRSDEMLEKWNFENDDKQNQEISEIMRKYADNFDEFFETGTGLLLYGSIGTGKTYYAACIVNALVERFWSAYMTNFSRILNQLQTAQYRQDYIDGIVRYPLLVIDDLGSERESSFARELIYNVIDSRYKTNMPVVITTNLSLSEIMNCKDVERRRIYDRLLEMCCPIQITGKSKRAEKAKQRYAEVKNLLGI